MDPKTLVRPLLLYTGLLGLLTVGAAYLATRSGLVILVVAGGGLLLAVLGGGTASSVVNSSGTEPADGDGLGMEATGLSAYTNTESSLRLVLLCYGSGVLLWSLVVLFTLRETLV
ncbi:hypothetical protein [Salinirubrum litoreum]|uniref:DUF8070 domain-containing protein n=1 Tax=Salinirubrum litoreum TaxID=1126234 RepID=A0ABD5RH31_9EURY|nr:hypothetical protein [Salinirubrum litoreum]